MHNNANYSQHNYSFIPQKRKKRVSRESREVVKIVFFKPSTVSSLDDEILGYILGYSVFICDVVL